MEPPPVERRFGFHGHHAMALTAATWSLNMCSGVTPVRLITDCAEKTQTRLSFPPVAR